MYKKSILILAFALVGLITIVTPLLAADSYYLYVNWNPGVGHTTGMNGYVDATGAIEGIPGGEYVFFTGGPSYGGSHTGYIYRVETAGDPNMHPDNPDATGPVAPRTFTFVSSHYMGNYASGHENAFYVDHTGIYYGAAPGWGGIFHWDFDWNPLGWLISTAAPSGTQTLARNPASGDWWVGTWDRRLYKWQGSSWVYQFTHPNLAGGHHDGMEIIGSSLFISDMTSDVVIQYRLDDSGDPIDPPGSPHKTFTYSAGPYVEGMGYGPNKHIWISGWNSYTIYEIGGGELQIALEGIRDQCVLAGDAFDTFDLDDYTAGLPPFTWAWTGNVNLTISADDSGVVTVTYPDGWWGEETVSFTVTDGLGRSASDDATFTVDPVPDVADVPDQSAPFVSFDLDDYLDGIDPDQVTWTASGTSCLVVEIDPVTHVATVTNPGEACTDAETIIFTANAAACGQEVSDEDEATFTPILPVEIDIKPQSCPNPFRTASRGVVPVAILGTEEFDVTTVDPSTVELEGVLALRDSLEDVSTPIDREQDSCACTTEGADGYMDMTLKFDTQEVLAALGEVSDGEIRVLPLTGETYDGVPILGQDCVIIIKKKKAAIISDVFEPARVISDRPSRPVLGNNYPNPFNPETDISFSLPERTQVSLVIYNVLGERIKTLLSAEVNAGVHTVRWDGRDESGNSAASGIYFFKLTAGDFTAAKRMVLIK